MEKTIYVNRPASRTWNRLGVNEAAVRWDMDAEALLSNERFTAVSGENAPLRIEAADGGAAYGRRVYTVTAEAGAELTVFEVCTAAQPLAAELRLTAAEGAHLRVVQLLNPARGAVLRHELSAQLAEHARLDLISLQLGDGAVYADHQIALAGDGAAQGSGQMFFQIPVLRSRIPSMKVKSQPTVISIVVFNPIFPFPPLWNSPTAPQDLGLALPGTSTGYTFIANALALSIFTKSVTSI